MSAIRQSNRHFRLQNALDSNSLQMITLKLCFSTGVPRNPWVPYESVGVPPKYTSTVAFSKFGFYGCLGISFFKAP